MSDQLTNNPEALRLFFTEDIYLVDMAQTDAGSSKLAAAKGEQSGTELPVANAAPQAEPVKTPNIAITAAIPALNINVPATAEPASIQEVPTIVTPEIPAPQAPAAKTFQYVGANERNILILVNDKQHPVSTLQGRELLGNILKAIGLSRNDCALVNYASCDGADFKALHQYFKPQYVFAFGVSPDQLGVPDAAYNSIVTRAESKLIFSSNLDPLSGDAATKKLLWGSLKQIKL
jgi:hypothetical protein